jgi:hypothetical protein
MAVDLANVHELAEIAGAIGADVLPRDLQSIEGNDKE